jgi:aryl-alcohol dehydrogenase-like predicted oxidoreductase
MSLNQLRVFGRSGTLISPLTLGTMNFGEGTAAAPGGTAGPAQGYAPTGAEDSIRIIHSA